MNLKEKNCFTYFVACKMVNSKTRAGKMRNFYMYFPHVEA
jgi:hypothetical protein